jgi:hypothetical protein
MLLRLDLAFGGEASPEQVRANDLAELGLRQQEEVRVGSAQDAQGRDHASLGRQEQRVAALPDP